MNWMKNLVDKVSTVKGGTTSPQTQLSPSGSISSMPGSLHNSSHESLSTVSSEESMKDKSANLDILKEYWLEYCSAKVDKDRAIRLNKLLHLFNQLIHDYPSDKETIFEIFGNMRTFLAIVARRFVKDVQSVWIATLPKDVNATAVLTFISSTSVEEGEVVGTEMVACIENIVFSMSNFEGIIETALPSTLVLVIQLFFALPSSQPSDVAKVQTVIRILNQLCIDSSTIQELIKTDTLILLFTMNTLNCPSHNVYVRENVLVVMETVIKHHSTRAFVSYLSQKSWLNHQFTALYAFDEFTPETLVKATSVIVSSLKESSLNNSQILLEDFRRAEGYKFLSQLLGYLEGKEACRSQLDNLFDIVTDLVYVGLHDLQPAEAASPYNTTLNTSTDEAGSCVRNIEAFQVLQSYFLESKDEAGRTKVLDRVLAVYAAHTKNFLILQQLRTLCYFIELFESLSFELRDGILRALSFVATVSNCVPFQELSSLSCLLAENPSPQTIVLIYQTAAKLVSFDKRYRHIFREVGLLDMVLNLLAFSHEEAIKLNLTELDATKSNSLSVVLDCISILIEDRDENLKILRERGAIRHVLWLVGLTKTRAGALQLLTHALKQDSEPKNSDMASLIELLQTASKKEIALKKDILDCLRRLFVINRKTMDSFRESGGFVCVVSLLVAMEGCFTADENDKEKLNYLETIFRTLTAGISSHPINRKFFREQIGHATLASAIRLTCILPTKHAYKILESLLDLATENVSFHQLESIDKVVIFNPDAIVVLLDLLTSTPTEVQLDIISKINGLLENWINRTVLAQMNAIDFILRNYQQQVLDPQHELHATLLKFIESVGSHSMTPVDLRNYFRLFKQKPPMAIYKSLSAMTKQGKYPPFIEFDLARSGFASATISSLGSHAWPPNNGYTISWWIYVDSFGANEDQFDLITFLGEDKQVMSKLFFSSKRLQFQTAPKAVTEFSSFPFEEKRWYHVAVAHTKHRFQHSEGRLFVNGLSVWFGKVSYPGNSSTTSIQFGATAGDHPMNVVWKMGPFYLIDEPLAPTAVQSIYNLGYLYSANFQGDFSQYQTYEIVNSTNLSSNESESVAWSMMDLSSAQANFQLSQDHIVVALNAINKKPVIYTKKDDTQAYQGWFITNSADLSSGTGTLVMGDATPFVPSSIPRAVRQVGGMPVMYYFIEQADNTQTLQLIIETMISLIQGNYRNTRDMEVTKGYEIVANFLRKKSSLLNMEIIENLLTFVGATPDPKESVVSNHFAFKHFVLYFDMWKSTPIQLQQRILQFINSLMAGNFQRKFNVVRLRRLNIVHEWLYLLQDDCLPIELFPAAVDVLYNILDNSINEEELHAISNYLITTLNIDTRSRKRDLAIRLQTIRTLILDAILKLLLKSDDKTVFLKLISINWLFHYISYDVDAVTALIATKIFVALYQTKSNFPTKFTQASGFKMLFDILPTFWNRTELYHALMCHLLGVSVAIVPENMSADLLDSLVMFKAPDNHIACIEALPIIFSMLRSSHEAANEEKGRSKITSSGRSDDDPISHEAVRIQAAVLQFLIYLFTHSNELQEYARTKTDLFDYLVRIVFIQDTSSEVFSLSDDALLSSGKINETIVLVYDFLCQVVDISFKTQAKGFTLLENIIEGAPYSDDDTQFVAYQTKILSDLIYQFEANCLKKDYVENSKLVSNMSKFAVFIVDKANQGLFTSNPRLVFDFVVHLLERTEDESVYKNNKPDIKDIYRSLNRIILHLASNDNKTDVMHTLNNIIYHQRFVFNENNSDQEFIYSLGSLVFPLFLHDNPEIRESSMNTWKMMMITKPNLIDPLLTLKGAKGEVIDLKTNGFDLLLQKDYNAFSFWIGDQLSMLQGIMDTLKKAYTNYKSAEDKNKSDIAKALKTRRHLKYSKKFKRDKVDYLKRQKLDSLLYNTTSMVNDVESNRFRKHKQDELDRQKYVQNFWEHTRKRLIRERGFDNEQPSSFDRWKLDFTEGPTRMRKKLEKNFNFFYDYPYISEETLADDQPKPPTSFDSKVFWAQHSTFSTSASSLLPLASASMSNLLLDSNALTSSSSNNPNNNNSSLSPSQDTTPIMSPLQSPLQSPHVSPPSSPSRQRRRSASIKELPASDDMESEQDESETESSKDKDLEEEFEEVNQSFEGGEAEQEDQKIQRLLEPGDVMQNVYNCGRVQGMDRISGLFLVCASNIYVIDNYAINPLGDIVEVNTTTEKKSRPYTEQEVRKWAYDDLRDILKRRYLLRPVALEIFSNDGRSCLVAFDNLNDREEVHKNLVMHTPDKSSVEDLVGLQNSDTDFSATSLRKLSLPNFLQTKTSGLTQKWVQGQISNFQYLMHLNTMAGRTYNDLTQYPVFPWVLQDYESEELDLNNPAVYRDLSKPMGALSKRRAEEFKIRYENWVDPEGLIPSFHYGSHYSSAATVLYYLIRLEPFTRQSVNLQGGRWDKPDRIFHSVKQTWQSASDGNTAEVMELIPEFYYLPEFLENSNKFDLGKKQTGAQIDDVLLPTWAKGDARLFIKKMRQALESDYVSEHLHEWIDLIFGYKQRGKDAEEALNVFYYLTYEGAVDIDAISDETTRNATIAQINNFGQTPSQLFKKPHAKRQVSASSQTIYSHPNNLVCSSLKEKGEKVGQIRLNGEKVLVIGVNRMMLPPHYNKFIAWGFPDHCARIYSGDKMLSIIENLHDGQITCITSTETGKILVTGGADSVVSVYRVRKSNNVRKFFLASTLCGHLGSVTCVAVSRSYSIIVSASVDKTCIVWDLNRLNYVRQLTGFETPVIDIVVSDATGEIFTATATTVTVWSINGFILATRKIASETEAITCISLSRGPDWLDSNVIMTGHKDGSIRVWSCFETSAKLDPDHPDKKLIPYELINRAQLIGHSKAVSHIFIPKTEQRRLFSGDDQGQVLEWKFPETSASKYEFSIGAMLNATKDAVSTIQN